VVAPGIELGSSGTVARNSNYWTKEAVRYKKVFSKVSRRAFMIGQTSSVPMTSQHVNYCYVYDLSRVLCYLLLSYMSCLLPFQKSYCSHYVVSAADPLRSLIVFLRIVSRLLVTAEFLVHRLLSP
jgi:hypothetical protein